VSPASAVAARTVVQALAAAGVREWVLAPGSRSAPLVYALAEAARPERPLGAPPARVHVRLDERDAAFLALGVAKAAAATGRPRPVVVVTTSGTAVANLLPATLEAHHSGVPLVLLTADRPRSLRGTGANQTTVQPGLLEPAVRRTVELEADDAAPEHLRAQVAAAVALALGVDPGPVHLNLGLPEPLVPDDEGWPDPVPAPALRLGAPPLEAPPLPDGPATVVVAGDGAGQEARLLAEARGWPLLAEPASGARGGPAAVPAYRLLLDAWADRVERAVVVGRPTLSRPVARLLTRVPVVRVQRPSAAWPEAGRGAQVLVPRVPESWFEGVPRPGWLESWREAGHRALALVRETAAGPGPLTGPALAGLVAEASGPQDVLVLGSSNPVRDVDLVADWETAPLVLANRGLAGIDGTTATAAGVALALPGRTVRALLGDLTFLHDVGGLLVGPLEERPRLQLVVANDDGGSVFATLEHGAPERAAVFERFFGTPHGTDLAAICRGYGVAHRLLRGPEELTAALDAPAEGLEVLEVPVDRAGRRALDRALAERVAALLG